MSSPSFILFKYPSRGRPERFFASLDSLVNNVKDVDYYHVAITLDDSDATMIDRAARRFRISGFMPPPDSTRSLTTVIPGRAAEPGNDP